MDPDVYPSSFAGPERKRSAAANLNRRLRQSWYPLPWRPQYHDQVSRIEDFAYEMYGAGFLYFPPIEIGLQTRVSFYAKVYMGYHVILWDVPQIQRFLFYARKLSETHNPDVFKRLLLQSLGLVPAWPYTPLVPELGSAKFTAIVPAYHIIAPAIATDEYHLFVNGQMAAVNATPSTSVTTTLSLQFQTE